MTISAWQDFLLLIGRLFFSVIFIPAGLQKLINFAGTVASVNSLGLPYPDYVAALTIILELGGAILIVLGLFARFGAFLILIFVLSVSFLVHNFWDYTEPALHAQMLQFLKNLSIMGGALYIMGVGPGAFSFDHLRRRA